MEFTYSIIIPHKNIPDLLRRCLDSIPRRKDVQIIVVDDNSSSEKVDFANFPGKERDGVEIVYTTEGKGAGYARNRGLERVKGKWLLFADADDYFLPDMLDIIDFYKDKEYDLITFRAESVNSDTYMPVVSRQYNSSAISEDMDVDILRYRNDVPWAKMISTQLVRDYRICFDETPAGNDAMFAAYVDYYARQVAACSRVIYCATVREESLQYGVNLENLLARVFVACRYNRFLRRIGRNDKYVSSFSRVLKCRESFGLVGYCKAWLIYLRYECSENIYKTFIGLLKAKLRYD